MDEREWGGMGGVCVRLNEWQNRIEANLSKIQGKVEMERSGKENTEVEEKNGTGGKVFGAKFGK